MISSPSLNVLRLREKQEHAPRASLGACSAWFLVRDASYAGKIENVQVLSGMEREVKGDKPRDSRGVIDEVKTVKTLELSG
jgi:hypothetical protein